MDQADDADGWRWIYGNRHLWAKSREDDRPEVCFTGFGAGRRSELEELAAAAGFNVRASVTARLQFLVVGTNAGPMKIQKAKGQGVAIVEEQQFVATMNGQ